MTRGSGCKHNRRLRIVAVLSVVLLTAVLWTVWAERYPQRERDLRDQLQTHLLEQLPAAMQSSANRYGIFPQAVGGDDRRSTGVLLVHGLDEPGGIWADLLPVLDRAGFDSWEFRYPNDQAIDRSADLLASSWPELPADQPVVLIGHSMGGLVIREFVSRYRNSAAVPPAQPGITGATVRAVILAGTPNQGSDWARMRVLLELRDQWAAGRQSGFSPLAGLQDGTGAAKIDLRPGSAFLTALNARPWPREVPIHIIGAVLVDAAPALGDGVVAPDSLTLAGGPEPILVAASHRGMLTRLFADGEEPPAIPVILTLLDGLESSR